MSISVEDMQQVVEKMTRARKALYKMTLDDGNVALDEWLAGLESDIEYMETFVREEAYAIFGHYDEPWGHVQIDTVPEGVKYEKLSECTCEFILPVWLFRPRPKTRPPFHKRSYIREKQFWWALIQTIVPKEERFRWAGYYRTRETAVCEVKIFICDRWGRPDWDNWAFQPLLNALAAHDVIQSDHPSILTMRYTYHTVQSQNEETVLFTIDRVKKSEKE